MMLQLAYTLPTVDDRKGKTLAFNEVTGSVQAGPSYCRHSICC
jgi:hypothetical protein